MPRYLLHGARIVDGTGRPPLSGHAVVVEDGRIDGIVPETALPGDAPDLRRIDLAGCTLLPGLIDLHVHMGFGAARPTHDATVALSAARNLRVALHAGITTVRDVATVHAVSVAVRDAVAAGDVLGARAFVCGRGICMTGGHGSEPPAPPGLVREADGVDDCRKAVREQIKDGADFIKVLTNGPLNVVEFTQAEMDALVDEAHRCGRRVACHASILGATQMAVRAGVDTVEHGDDLDRETCRQMRERGIMLVPTLLVNRLIMDRWEEMKHLPMMRAIPIRARQSRASFQMALAEGVPMGAGSDIFSAMGRFEMLPEEIATMVEFGMAPMDALVAATRGGAEGLGLADRLGTIERGKIADVMAVEGDPVQDIHALGCVRFVMKEGQSCLAPGGDRE
jgi:imidazolonepropionase-like amidohydrolase